MCSFEASKFCSPNEELSLDDIKGFIKYESKRKLHIFLSGGEPFLREDIFEIIEAIVKSGLTCGICTNGTLLDEKKIKELIKLKPAFIIFSLHGVKDTHDKVTGVSGSFERLLKNIKILSSLNKIKIIVNCTVTRSNRLQLKELTELTETLRVSALRFEHLNFVTTSQIDAHRYICEKEFPGQNIELSSYLGEIGPYEDYHHFITQMQKVKNGFKIPVSFKPFLKDRELKLWYSDNFKINRRCFFIWRSLFISPSGDVIPCQFLIYKLGNIKTENLDSIWNNEKYRDLRLKLKRGLLPGCARCCKL
jgi:MoaA/NifB/PqqE/SkfB family radical SAM enzyme